MKVNTNRSVLMLAGITLMIFCVLPPTFARSNGARSPVRVLDHTIRCSGGRTGNQLPVCTVVELGDPPTVHFRGTRRKAQQFLVKRLRNLHGDGYPNLPGWTMGGKQFWADVFIHDNWRIQRNVFTGHTRLLDTGDVRRAWGSFKGTRTYFERLRLRNDIRNDSSHLVLLVHGIFRSKDSFEELRRALDDRGYEVAGVNYPSTQRSIRDHARQLETILDRSIGIDTVSFVTHSLGGLVVRKLLGRSGKWRGDVNVHRIVMLAPPNQGSAVSRYLKDLLPYQLLTGESGQDLTPAVVEHLPVPDVPVGVIAGTGEGVSSSVLAGEDDGTIAVDATRIEGMDDFQTVDAVHSFIMSHPETVSATVRFLATGHF